VEISLSGSSTLYFTGGNEHQHISIAMEQGGITVPVVTDTLATCSGGLVNATVFESVLGTGACATATGPAIGGDCENIVLMSGDGATYKGRENCPVGHGKCDVWTVPLDGSSPQAKVFAKFQAEVFRAASGQKSLALSDATSQDVYFKSGTNEIRAMKQQQSVQGTDMEMTLGFDHWDVTSEIDPSEFVIPSEWQPCIPAARDAPEVVV
jgi:hypothetical protein